jgi:hypothetical protein
MSSTSPDPQPVVDGRGGTILGPRNVAIETENSDVPPALTDDAPPYPATQPP